MTPEDKIKKALVTTLFKTMWEEGISPQITIIRSRDVIGIPDSKWSDGTIITLSIGLTEIGNYYEEEETLTFGVSFDGYKTQIVVPYRNIVLITPRDNQSLQIAISYTANEEPENATVEPVEQIKAKSNPFTIVK